MPWSTIRRATPEDYGRLEAAAERFSERHPMEIAFAGVGYEWHELDFLLTDPEIGPSGKRLAKLWKAAVRRALRNKGADGVAYGYVGYHVD